MKNTLLKGLLLLACCVVIFGIIGCEESMQRSVGGETHYLKYNFHYTTEKGRIKGSIANYTSLPGHKILPYGSSVKIAGSRSGFALIDEDSGRKIDVLAPSKYLAGKSLSDYLDLILSKTPVSYTDLSEIDRKGISEGRPYKGMSKKGVMIALGYPAPHRTASPDTDEWYYWRNRYAKYAVNFENGIVATSGY
jgi:hypothetical protein